MSILVGTRPSAHTTSPRLLHNMMYPLSLLVVLVFSVHASPIAQPQGVTVAISPSGPSPPGCTGSYVGGSGADGHVFGIAVLNVTAPGEMRRRAAEQVQSFSPSIQSAMNPS